MLSVNNLTKIYKTGSQELKAVNKISLSINRGEFVAIMGPSGSGKSTFLNLVGGIESPTSGTICVNNQQIESLSEDELALMRRKNVAFIYQFFGLLPDLTVAENIILPALIAGKRRHIWQKKLNDVLQLVDLTNRKDYFPSQLSGGEQQRTAIARALLVEPHLLLADEPTGSLDTQQGELILETLRSVVDNKKQTLILVTHDPKVAGYADRIIYFRDGQVVDESAGTTAEVEAINYQLRHPHISEET